MNFDVVVCIIVASVFIVYLTRRVRSLVSDVFVFSFFFFKQKTAYEMRISDWSSDVCSSDLHVELARHALAVIEDFLEGVGAERRIAGPAHLAEAVENIRLDFLGLHRVQMMRRDHPLAKLLERRRMEDRKSVV